QPAVRRWLGVALMPQAGVAIGMALLATQRFPDTASVVLTVAVASTVILETIGPVLTRLAIRKAMPVPADDHDGGPAAGSRA
ncbi:MAG TPA: hypothetical protein VLS87_09365, partial [Woeseiaceae bacterium]|nr:hypothetical protein [Woeseiaceae bacterium]